MKRKKLLVVMGMVLLLLVTLVAVSFAQGPFTQATYPDPGTSTTNIVVQNTSTSGGAATVQVQYYDTSGNLDYTHSSISISSKAVQEVKTQDETLSDGWQGSAVMSSDTPLAAIVSIKNTSVPGASDGKTQGAYNGSASGATTLYFPSVYGFQYIVSRLTVQNTESTQATIYASYYDRSGTFLGRKSATIPGFSQKTLNMGSSADVPFDPNNFTDGSAVVTSTNKLAGAAVTTWGNRSAAYQALTDANKGTTLYAPSHYRYKYDPSASSYTLFSALNLQNTSATSTANVTVKYYTRGSGALALTKNFTIASLSAKGLNTKNGGDFPASDFDALSKAGGAVPDWDGSVTITSDQPLVGICNTGWDAAAKAGAYALVTENDASNTLFVPAQYRIDWGSGWAQWSALNLMNVGGATISKSNLTIEYIDTNGSTVKTFTNTDLPNDLDPGAALGLNTRNGGDLNASAFNGFPSQGGLPRFIGGIYVTAPTGSKLVGVANVIYDNRASVYNTFPGQ